MTDVNARSALVALTDADIVRIVANGYVGRRWAQMAKVGYDDLRRGSKRGLRSVRAAIMRAPSHFARSLSHGWDFLVDPDSESDLHDLDRLNIRAEAAGHSLGALAARAMLSAVVENSHIADSQHVRERFDDLVKIAENAPLHVDDEAWEPDDLQIAEEETEQPIPVSEDAEPESGVSSKSGSVADAAYDADGLYSQAISLNERAADIAHRLRVAADAIESGRPAETIGEGPDEWSGTLRLVMEAAPSVVGAHPANLDELLECLGALKAEEATQESNSRRNALLAIKMVDLLREEGRADVIAETIAQLGFTSVEEAENAAGAGQSEALDDSGPEPKAGPRGGSSPSVGQSGSTETLAANLGSSTHHETELNELSELETDVGLTSGDYAGPADAVETQEAVEALPAGTTEDAEGVEAQSLVVPTELIREWPWDEGDPPVIASLLLAGREALAYYLAEAADEVPLRRQLLLFACAAAHCAPAAIELSLLPSDADVRPSTTESLVLLSAALRAGLRLGYAPLGLQALLDSADAALTDDATKNVLHAAAAAVQRGHGRRQPPSGPSEEEMAARWTNLGAEVAADLEKLRQKTLKLQRGTKVLRHLFREGQPLADALSTAAALTAQGVSNASSPEWSRIQDVADQLRDQGDRERLLQAAEAAVSTPQQRVRRTIDGPVKKQLEELLHDVGDQLARLLAVRRSILSAGDLKDMAISDDLERALSQAPHNPSVTSVGDAAVANFVEWLRADAEDPSAQSVQDVLDAALLELFEIPRDERGRPLRTPTAAEIALILKPRDPDQVVMGYLNEGNLAATREFISVRRLEGAGYEDEILQAAKSAKLRFEKAYGEAEEGAARLRALYKDDLARDLGERIRLIVDTLHDDRFDLAINGLQAISAEAEEALSVERELLIERTRALSCDEVSKNRVLDRIEARDEPLAVYFLSVLEAGGALQEVEPPSGDDFSEFVPRIVDIASDAQAAGQDSLSAVRDALHVTSAPSDRFLRDGLVAWQNLKTRKRSGEDFKRSLGIILRMIGLTPKAQGWYRGEVSRTTAGGYATIRVGADPVDRSYVPQFGSQALGEYDITLVWDPASPSRLMDFIAEGNRNRPNVFLYFGALSLAERRHLRTLTRTSAGGKGFSPIVIDEAVVGWLSHLAEPGWRFTQRVTLPFTTLNPYQPNAAGEVPEEVFVGRSDERVRIENPTGPMFVYGGRQLGKSALLRRVEHLYTDLNPSEDGNAVAGKAAVYIDLKAAGIGEAQEPAQLWPLLGERLRNVGVIPAKATARTSSDVTTAILSWLDSGESNQILLLLDEADNFLTADSNSREGDVGGFPVLQALKAVMEQSHRRFKAVFAGLHQVQRFFDASNTPVAHGGDAIPIGPLRTHDACDLVVSPLGALGYRFENAELVWRLLLVTNYQASLVQIVCDSLVRFLQKRQIPEAGGKMLITAEDVRDVCSDPKVRDLIAQRFRWTINLDSRYRVIALVVALNSIGADPGVRFSVDDLREECEVWWPDGFSPDELSRNEFERYLVEMQGLGILQQPAPDWWALRSPSVIQMLGTRDRLQKELDEAQTHLERPLEYNPTMARHIMGDSEGVAARRSPLTDYELTTLLKERSTAQVVFGSVALGIDRVVEVIQRQAKRDTEREALVVDSVDSAEFKRAGAGGKRIHVIVDLTQTKQAGNLAHICRQAAARKNVTSTVVIGPAWLEALESLDGVPVHRLRRWSTAGLRAWYGSPFDSPPDRARLHKVTSGWPKLIEEVMADFAAGKAPQDSLDRLAAQLASPERARQMLHDSGINLEVAKAWVESIPFSMDSAGGVEQLPVSVEDITEALLVDGATLLGRLESLDIAIEESENWFLDRVILAAAATLYKGRE